MSKRVLQINELLREELGQLFIEEIEWPLDILVTISRVETSGDFDQAKIWLSVLPVLARGRILKILNQKLGLLQNILNKKLVMRRVPRLIFKIDETEEKVEEIDNLLHKIREED